MNTMVQCLGQDPTFIFLGIDVPEIHVHSFFDCFTYKHTGSYVWETNSIQKQCSMTVKGSGILRHGAQPSA